MPHPRCCSPEIPDVPVLETFGCPTLDWIKPDQSRVSSCHSPFPDLYRPHTGHLWAFWPVSCWSYVSFAFPLFYLLLLPPSFILCFSFLCSNKKDQQWSFMDEKRKLLAYILTKLQKRVPQHFRVPEFEGLNRLNNIAFNMFFFWWYWGEWGSKGERG